MGMENMGNRDEIKEIKPLAKGKESTVKQVNNTEKGPDTSKKNLNLAKEHPYNDPSRRNSVVVEKLRTGTNPKDILKECYGYTESASRAWWANINAVDLSENLPKIYNAMKKDGTELHFHDMKPEDTIKLLQGISKYSKDPSQWPLLVFPSITSRNDKDNLAMISDFMKTTNKKFNIWLPSLSATSIAGKFMSKDLKTGRIQYDQKHILSTPNATERPEVNGILDIDTYEQFSQILEKTPNGSLSIGMINASESPILIDHEMAQKPIVYDKSKWVITYLDEKNEKSFSFWKTASDYLTNRSSSFDRMYAAQ